MYKLTFITTVILKSILAVVILISITTTVFAQEDTVLQRPQFVQNQLKTSMEFRLWNRVDFVTDLAWGTFTVNNSSKVSFVMSQLDNIAMIMSNEQSSSRGDSSFIYVIRVDVDANLPAPDSKKWAYTSWQSGVKTVITLKYCFRKQHSTEELFIQTRGYLSLLFTNLCFVKLYDEE